jgi:hypothetical protein
VKVGEDVGVFVCVGDGVNVLVNVLVKVGINLFVDAATNEDGVAGDGLEIRPGIHAEKRRNIAAKKRVVRGLMDMEFPHTCNSFQLRCV